MCSLLVSLLLPHFGGTSLYKHNRLACLCFQTLIALHLYLWEESQPRGAKQRSLSLCTSHCCSTLQCRLLFPLLAIRVSQSVHPLVFSYNYFFQWRTWRRINWWVGDNPWTHWVWQNLTVRQVLSKQGKRRCTSVKGHSECWQLIWSNISRFPGKLIA